MVTAWPGFYFDGKNRYNTTENGSGNNVSSANIASMASLWTFNAGSGTFTASPVTEGTRVYIGNTNGSFYALPVATGTPATWSISLGTAINATAYTTGGQVYIPCSDGKLYKRNAATGASTWTFDSGAGGGTAGAFNTAPATYVVPLSTRFIVAGSANGKVYSIADATGAQQWVTDLSAIMGGAVLIGGAIALSNGILYVPVGGNLALPGAIVALTATTGAFVRAYYCRTGATPTVPCLATDSNGVEWLIFGASDHYLYAYKTSNGAPLWSDLQGGDIRCGVAIDTTSNWVINGTSNWNEESHDWQTLFLRWIKTAVSAGGVRSTACIANGVTFSGTMATDDRLWGFRTTNTQGGQNPRMHVNTGGSVESSPIEFDGKVVVGCDDGKVYAAA